MKSLEKFSISTKQIEKTIGGRRKRRGQKQKKQHLCYQEDSYNYEEGYSEMNDYRLSDYAPYSGGYDLQWVELEWRQGTIEQ